MRLTDILLLLLGLAALVFLAIFVGYTIGVSHQCP